MNRTQLLTIAMLMIATTAMPAQAWIGLNGGGANGCEANAITTNGADVNGITRNSVDVSGVTLVAIEIPRDSE